MVSRTPRSLSDRFPGRIGVPCLLAAATLLLPAGLFLPTVALRKAAGTSGSEFSVLTGIADLARGGNLLLALIIFIFSFTFPVVKLTALWVLWYRRMPEDSVERTLHRLKSLGKWSMLDVFVVSVFVGSVRFGILARATPRYGIYLFSGAVILSMIATFAQLRLVRVHAPSASSGARPSLAALPVAALALLFLSAGLALPLMETRKWVFWKEDYSVISGTAALAREGNVLLATGIAVFVVVLPVVALAGQIALVLLRRSGRPSGPLVRALEVLGKWTMVDVFALGVLVVFTKVGAVADVSPRLGLGCFVLGVVLSSGASWFVRD